MKKRVLWFFIGALTAGVAAYAVPRFTAPEPLTEDQRESLQESGFEPITIVERIEVPVEVPVEVIVRERFEVRVPGEPVEPC